MKGIQTEKFVLYIVGEKEQWEVLCMEEQDKISILDNHGGDACGE